MVDPAWVRICDLARLAASSAKYTSLIVDKDALVSGYQNRRWNGQTRVDW